MTKEDCVRRFAQGESLTTLHAEATDFYPIDVLREFIKGVFITIESLSRKMQEAAMAKEQEG